MVQRVDGVPLYQQLRTLLRKQIERGEYQVGDALPPEHELMAMWGVSRTTVRQAVSELVAEGLVRREQGKGTFVQRPRLKQQLNTITSWAETTAMQGVRASSRLLSAQEVTPDPEIARVLELPSTVPVLELVRLRCIESKPVTLMRNFLPARMFPGLVDLLEGRESLYELLETVYGVEMDRALETVHAKGANAEESKHLQVPKGYALLAIQRVTYLATGKPFEVVRAVSKSDMYAYEVHLQGRPRRR